MPNIADRSFGYTDPNFPNPNGQNDTSIIIYGYTPSIGLAAFAAVWFFAHLVGNLMQNFTSRSWWWMTFTTGLVFEITGYIYFFIVTSPVFLAAGVYTVLSALISRLGDQYCFVQPKVILGLFITSDAVSTIVQIGGACLVGVKAPRREDPTTANRILLAGLAYQVCAMSFFVILMGIFQLRAQSAIKEHGYRTFCCVFSISTIMVYLRTIFRLAETAEGLGGRLSSNEVFFACLEFAPISIVVLLLDI
ncbi:uncharacterized protein N7484_002506 [Penicillium longicatenatum]|uniref:uncharacterized protein n=1 Tax=Penicillium longicatenatum TaxID=1561947 RepID=UPI002546AF51|nr:uncharacterized protein N7484_002506 [Penicillium longicatenatum]KAJ5658857.1 hypothetical protein N7484_002506 [Penicillium longicatenatum]